MERRAGLPASRLAGRDVDDGEVRAEEASSRRPTTTASVDRGLGRREGRGGRGRSSADDGVRVRRRGAGAAQTSEGSSTSSKVTRSVPTIAGPLDGERVPFSRSHATTSSTRRVCPGLERLADARTAGCRACRGRGGRGERGASARRPVHGEEVGGVVRRRDAEDVEDDRHLERDRVRRPRRHGHAPRRGGRGRSRSSTVERHGERPALAKTWRGLFSVEVPPSPNDQSHDDGSPEERSEKATLWPGAGRAGRTANAAMGGPSLRPAARRSNHMPRP